MKRVAYVLGFIGTFLLIASSSAIAQSSEGTSGNSGNATPSVSGEASPQVSEKTKTYIEQAAMTDLFEIQSSKLALKKSRNADIQAFAKQMIHDHGESTRSLQAILKKDKWTAIAPTKLDQEHAKMLGELESATDQSFDSLYVKMQLEGHRTALDMHKAYASSGDHTDLKAFANKTSKVVNTHLTHITELASKLHIEG